MKSKAMKEKGENEREKKKQKLGGAFTFIFKN
jgi:hypothetical protein